MASPNSLRIRFPHACGGDRGAGFPVAETGIGKDGVVVLTSHFHAQLALPRGDGWGTGGPHGLQNRSRPPHGGWLGSIPRRSRKRRIHSRKMNQHIVLCALANALGATAYIALVATIFANQSRFFGKTDGIIQMMALPLLLVLSIIVMGILLVLPSLRLYLDGQKEAGVRLLMTTTGCLGACMIMVMVSAALR
jgi:hypothetical protein